MKSLSMFILSFILIRTPANAQTSRNTFTISNAEALINM